MKETQIQSPASAVV